MVRFIGSAPGKPISRPSGLAPSASPTAVARSFLGSHGKAFGIGDQANELRVMSVRTVSAGRSVVRFQQNHEGVPVLGGELVVNLDDTQNVLSAGGDVLPSPAVSVLPRIESSAATGTALEAVAKARSVPASTLQASKPSLWIYDSRILGGPGLAKPTLVWRMDVTGTADSGPIDELVLVDAQLGIVALHFNQIEEAKYRQVCDANNADARVPCTTPFDRVEGGAASAIADVNGAYDNAGATYDFYLNYLGRDGIDGAGMTIKSTTRYCDPSSPCPYENAYWDGTQMVYGQGYASADDVVGHELTHGVTDHTSRLFYYYQSGAINESLSDTFGEFVDLTDGTGNDAPSVRWKLGEDLPGGAIRDMKNPPLYDQPDTMTSSNYTADLGGSDNGGVHTNSGVNNKAAFLITDGGSFNGKTVTGLGITKAAKIYYEVETNLLTSASDYADLYNALQQACTNLIGTAGITSSDCTQVTNAVDAVEMNVTPPAAPAPEAPVCSSGQSPHDLFFDNLENTASGNWVKQLGSGLYQEWFYPQNPNDVGLDATYATSGTTNFWGYDQLDQADYSIAMKNSVAIPAGSTPYLRFNHSFGFENDGTPTTAYDGGVLEYSTNGGASWADAGSLLTNNGYNGTISSSYQNPLGGRSAFVRESNGYISSRANLASLAGQSVRFRFRIGTDTSGDDYGWFVDDIRVYTCSAPTFAFSSATYSVGEAGPSALITINRSGSTTGTDSVHFATADGTATAGSDYTAVSQDVSFSPGETSKTVSIPITDDSVVENDETVSLSLSSPSTGAVLGDPHAATLTILDNDVALLALSAASYSVSEAGPTASVTITRSRNTLSSASVHFATADGTATAGSDYTPVSQDVSFAAGETSKTVDIPIIDDSLVEGNETVSLALSSPSAEARLGSPSTATLTIIDNDRSFAFSAASFSAGESAGSASITIERAGSTAEADSVHFATANGTATAGSDYTAVSQDVTFAAGQTSKTVSVPITNDSLLENNETVSLALSSPSAGATLGSLDRATLTIQDNAAVIAFSAPTYSVKESRGPSTITLRRTGFATSAVSVHFATANGSARSGLDYTPVSQTVSFAAGESSKTVAVPITNDKLLESTETVRLTLSSPSVGAVLGSPGSASLSIVNNPGKIISAKLTKKSFAGAQARKVKLVISFSPASKKFDYLLSFKKGARWVSVRSVKKNGNFSGTRSLTVKSLFGKKALVSGLYRVKLSADANAKTRSFKLT
jgi:Zn-dependent metalloprotease